MGDHGFDIFDIHQHMGSTGDAHGFTIEGQTASGEIDPDEVAAGGAAGSSCAVGAAQASKPARRGEMVLKGLHREKITAPTCRCRSGS